MWEAKIKIQLLKLIFGFHLLESTFKILNIFLFYLSIMKCRYLSNLPVKPPPPFQPLLGLPLLSLFLSMSVSPLPQSLKNSSLLGSPVRSFLSLYRDDMFEIKHTNAEVRSIHYEGSRTQKCYPRSSYWYVWKTFQCIFTAFWSSSASNVLKIWSWIHSFLSISTFMIMN